MPSALAPLVSICVPTLSAQRLPYLREAMASARSQTHTNVEILIRDDGSQDAIRDFVLEQARTDDRVHYARNETRQGLGGNWNALAQWARGEFIVIIGDDDRLLPSFVSRLLSAFTPETAVAFSNHYVIDADGARVAELTRQFLVTFGRASLPSGMVAEPAACVWQNSVPMSASLLRASHVKRLGIKTDLNTPEIELFARLAAEGHSFVFEPDYLAEYRVHSQSQTSAGLAGERLLKYLDPIPVPAHVEPLKRRLLAGILIDGVNKSLKGGDVIAAREMMRHRYYPSIATRPVRILAQKVFAALPSPVTKWSFGVAVAARQAIRRSPGP
jgi:glycosyltransferase involved in cell wall biosynthesis